MATFYSPDGPWFASLEGQYIISFSKTFHTENPYFFSGVKQPERETDTEFRTVLK